MKTILHLGVAALLLTGCHRSGSSMQREQQQYEVVQEGAASGVTSTINAPGETPPPITNTNADTTTAFAGFGNGNTPVTTAQPGSLGGTLPPPDYSREVAAAPPRPTPVARTARPQPQPEAPPPPMTSAQQAPPPTTEETTSTAPPAPEQTETTKTSTESQEKESEPEAQPEPQPPAPQPEPQPPAPQPPTNT